MQRFLNILIFALATSAHAEKFGSTQPNSPTTPAAPAKSDECKVVAQGEASVYGLNSNVKGDASNQQLASMCGRKPCRLDVNAMTAAMLNVRYGTEVQVTHARTGKTITVKVNDCGPHVAGRAIDLTPAAGRAVGIGHQTGKVIVKVCPKKDGKMPKWEWASKRECGSRTLPLTTESGQKSGRRTK